MGNLARKEGVGDRHRVVTIRSRSKVAGEKERTSLVDGCQNSVRGGTVLGQFAPLHLPKSPLPSDPIIVMSHCLNINCHTMAHTPNTIECVMYTYKEMKLLKKHYQQIITEPWLLTCDNVA
jgi:hypothetical protein